MQAVILAAGQGRRIRSLSDSKPLLPLLGLPLIERNVRAAQQCGVDEVIIVTGYEHERLDTWRQEFQARHAMPRLTMVYNEAWAETENGQSLAAAKDRIKGPFLLLMGDHVYTPELLRELCQHPLPEDGAVLAVDGKTGRKDIDLEDVTRVQLRGENVVAIDKGLTHFDGFDTGAFWCSPAVAEQAAQQAEAGRTRLSDTMQALADAGRLAACRIDGAYWQDVDTPETHRLAERGLLAWAAGKGSDGPVSRWLNRPLSRWLTGRLIHTGITPNQVSLVAFALGLVAAVLLAQPYYLTLLLGGLLVQFASVVDGCDGEIARLRLAPSAYGGWLDALLDRYADAAVLGALTWHVAQTQAGATGAWLVLGLAAIAGSFVASYSAHKADRLLTRQRWRIGRDTRSLAVMLGAVFAVPELVLALVAVTMNAVVVYRIFALRKVM